MDEKMTSEVEKCLPIQQSTEFLCLAAGFACQVEMAAVYDTAHQFPTKFIINHPQMGGQLLHNCLTYKVIFNHNALFLLDT